MVPYRLGLSPAEVRPTLSQFQGVGADKEGTLKLLGSINQSYSSPLPEERLQRLFEKLWPELEAKLDSISGRSLGDGAAPRSEADYLQEILEIVRRDREENHFERFAGHLSHIFSLLRKFQSLSPEALQKALDSAEAAWDCGHNYEARVAWETGLKWQELQDKPKT